MRLIAPTVLILLVACGSGEDGGDGGGGPLPPLELQVVRWEDGGQLLPVASGDVVPLVNAPQGGHFLFVAARVRNLAGHDVDMFAEVEDAQTGEKINVAVARPFMITAADGWSDPEHETFTTLDMVQLCPMGVGLDLDGRAVKLTLRVHELSTKRTAASSVEIRPACGDSPLCQCECAAEFQPGECM